MELSHPAIGRLRTVKKVEDCLWTRSFTFQEPAQLAWRASADNKKANRCLRMRLSTFQELLIAASRAPLTAQGSERPAIGLVCANERTERRLRPRLWTFRTLLQSARSLSANRAKTDHRRSRRLSTFAPPPQAVRRTFDADQEPKRPAFDNLHAVKDSDRRRSTRLSTVKLPSRRLRETIATRSAGRGPRPADGGAAGASSGRRVA